MSLYNPPHFRITERASLLEAISLQPFATLVSNGPDGPLISHLPLMLIKGDGEAQPDRLIGHLARPNMPWREASSTQDSVVIFHGPDAYVSPDWYPSKRAHGRVVPTWNYSVIHAAGRLIIHDDAEWLRTAVTQLTDRHEANRSAPWAVSDAPEAFINGQLKGIVGVELVIARLEGKVKFSQNRSAEDQAGVIAGLGHEHDAGSAAVHRLMSKQPAT